MLRIIKVKNLIQFTEEVSAALLPNIPITPLRALSQYHNPVSSPDDPALIIAYNEAKEIIAYFGCLPDRIAKAPHEKICWSSCWWGHPEKGKGATMQVFYQALKLWEGKMLFDALPEKSEAILTHMGFFSFRRMDGMRGFLRFKWRKILTTRFPALGPFGFVFTITDFVMNGLYSLRLAFWKKLISDITVEQLVAIDDAAANFIEVHKGKELIGRNQTSLNWIVKYPWLTETPNGTGPFTNAYYFSAYAKSFKNIILKVSHHQKVIAVLFLTLRDGEMKLPYVYFEKGKEDLVAELILQKMIAFKAETFVCFQKELLNHFQNNKNPFYHLRPIDKIFGYSSSLEKYMTEDVLIQDGDGDVVFT